MPPGPRPQPTAEKKLRGNPGQRKLNDAEAEPEALFTLPDPPDYIGEYGRREWNRVGPELIRIGLLTKADLMTFEAYCLNVQLMIDSRNAIEDEGMTIEGGRGPVRNPALAAFSQATTAVRALGSEFGMTPSSRSRIKLPTDDEDTLAKILGADDGSEDFSAGV